MTTRYVSPTGSGTACTIGSPCTLATAVGGGSSPVVAGDTVEMTNGIYQHDTLTFGPAGSSSTVLTIFKAAAGARPIITSTTNTIPRIALRDYMRLDGIWMGGSKSVVEGEEVIVTGDTPISNWKQIVNCTIFGGNNGLISGSSQYLTIQGCRFVHNGFHNLYHATYISAIDTLPPPTDSFTQHVIMDKNIVIGGGTGGGDDGGYGIQYFHNNRTGIATRNFVTYHYGYVYDGQYGLFANNYCWKCGTHDASDIAVNWGYPTNSMLINNIMGGPNDFVINTEEVTNTVNKNAYESSSNGGFSKGSNPISLTAGSELTQQGITAVALDAAIAALNASFAASPTIILADSTIETNFAIISGITIPGGSPLRNTGQPWYSAATINVGPDCGSPSGGVGAAGSVTPFTVNDIGCWWAAFRGLGMLEFDNNAIQITSGFLPCVGVGGGSASSGAVKFSGVVVVR